MRRKLGVIILVVAVIIVFIGISSDGEGKDHRIFHVTLADPQLYVNGVFAEEFVLEVGEYRLRFTPNGGSPKDLSITVTGESILLEENFKLNGTLHDTGISQYHTWEYLGSNILTNNQMQTVQIIINPNGDLLGPVSVSLLREE